MKSAPATMVGLAVGDALGMPFEHFSDRVDPRLATWDGNYVAGSWPDRLTHTLDGKVPMPSLPAGCWTDDTGMAMALAKSLMACGKYDPVDAANGWEDPHAMPSGQCGMVSLGTGQARPSTTPTLWAMALPCG